MRMFRDVYFEDYQAKEVPYKNKTRISYVYSGIWKQWDVANGTVKKQKMLYSALELVQVMIFLAASMQHIPFNFLNIVGGFAICSIVPWIFEILGVVKFCFSPKYITDLEQKTVSGYITFGTLIHAILLGIATVSGSVMSIINKELDIKTILVIMMYFCCCYLSLKIFFMHNQVQYKTFRNRDGKVGNEY